MVNWIRMQDYMRHKVRLLLLALLCLLTASAAFHGFYSKWGMREDAKAFGLQAVFDGTVARPWAYRQLMPATANAIDAALPSWFHKKATARLMPAAEALHFDQEVTAGPALAIQPTYTIRYFLVYYMAFGALLLSMPLMIRLCQMQGFSLPASLIGSTLFVLAMPVLETVGGYYYDLGELFFMFAYLVLLSDRRLRFLCVPLAIVATVNKESFLAFVVTTVPLALTLTTFGDVRHLRRLVRDRAALVVTSLAAFGAFAIHLAMVPIFAAHPGTEALWWLYHNVFFYLDPRSLFRTETTYGLPLFAGYSIVTLLLFVSVTCYGFIRLSPRLRAYSIFALAVNFPLLMLFAFPGEMRNLSFLYPPALLCMVATIDRLVIRPAQAPVSG